jgi:hypothetical protein
MAKICYVPHRFGANGLDLIDKTNLICAEYTAQGYDLSLRQAYYQFVARGWLPNTMRDYKNLGSVINDGRLAGLIDWDFIVDRTRNIRGNAHWGDPSEIIDACARQFQVDKWATQPYYCECWVEKEALVGVLERICKELDISYFACRGYVSQSEIHEAAKDRLIPREENGQKTLVIHLGDHDPSGIDMTRDIQDRLRIFGCEADVQRIALNMDQVEQYNPPPNPAKLTDSRATGYVDKFGNESWELDALEPKIISKLISDVVMGVRDTSKWKKAVEKEKTMKKQLQDCSENWEDVTNFLERDN